MPYFTETIDNLLKKMMNRWEHPASSNQGSVLKHNYFFYLIAYSSPPSKCFHGSFTRVFSSPCFDALIAGALVENASLSKSSFTRFTLSLSSPLEASSRVLSLGYPSTLIVDIADVVCRYEGSCLYTLYQGLICTFLLFK